MNPRFFRKLRAGLVPVLLLFSALPVLRAATYDYPGYFGPSVRWASTFSLADEVPGVGDFNGDGLDDLVTFVRSSASGSAEGNVYVAINNGSGRFGGAVLWNDWFSIQSEVPLTGDFDGDGRSDIATFIPGGGVYVARSSGTAFIDSRLWFSGFFMHAGEFPLAGDFNGDGRDDIAVCTRGSSADVFVSLSTGTGFGNQTKWHDNFCPGTGVPRAGDVNGDGRADLICFVRDSRAAPAAGDVEVALSNGSSAFQFNPVTFWHQNFAPTADYEPLVMDLNGDGSLDIAAVDGAGRMFAAVKTAAASFASGTGTETADPFWQWHHDVRSPGETPLAGRFNRDLNADLAIFVRNLRGGADNGAVYVSLCAGHAEPEPESRLADFGYGTIGAGTAPVVKPLLVILSECSGRPLSRTQAQYEQGVFGPAHPNVAGWFDEMSGGKFRFSRAGLFRVGPYVCPLPDENGVRTQLEDAANADGNGGFEFKNFDSDGDGIVENHELALLGISTFFRAGGQTFGVDAVVFPGTPRQVRVLLTWCFAGDNDTMTTMAHELCHGSCGMADLYGSNCRGFNLTLASCTAGETTPSSIVHLDAWHKIRMGWVKPQIYDLRYFPAGAALRPAQRAGGTPVILYDSARGTGEFFVLEHRNGLYSGGTATWTAAGGTWRAAPRTSWPAAGYDIDVQDTSVNRQGFLTWAVKTDAAHNVLDIVQRVGPGTNGLINSARAGDDILWPSAAAATQIHCGPDGVLQSAAAGDDVFWADALALPMSNPADMIAREVSSLNPAGRTATTLQFYNSADTGVVVHGDAVNGDTWQFLEWGKNFRPFISLVAAPAAPVRPGDSIIATGSLGRRDRYHPMLVSADGARTPLIVSTWTGAGSLLKLPAMWLPPGRNRLVLFDGTAYKPSSNSWLIEAADACVTWLEDHFTPSERANAAVSGDAADPDRDGQPNLVEMVMGTDPRTGNAVPWTWDVISGEIVFTFPARRDRCAVRISVQTSPDLTAWTSRSSVDVVPVAGSTSLVVPGFLRAPVSGARMFARLKIDRL